MAFQPPKHRIIDLKPYQKNLELNAIILEIQEKVFLKKTNQNLTKILIADDTGSVYFNVFDKASDGLQIGDIIYIHNSYTTKFQDQMILYHGRQGILKKIGEFYFVFKEKPFLSKQDWSHYNPPLGNNIQNTNNASSSSNNNNNQNSNSKQYNSNQEKGNDNNNIQNQQKHNDKQSQNNYYKSINKHNESDNSNNMQQYRDNHFYQNESKGYHSNKQERSDKMNSSSEPKIQKKSKHNHHQIKKQ